jgi:hypothetical protein
LTGSSTQVTELIEFVETEDMGTIAKAVARRFTSSVVALLLLPLTVPALGQERMVLGPRQFERDNGAGAVLCAWSVYLSVQVQTAACGLPRRPVDDAIDEAIVAIDEFIIANSSLHPTREMLEEFKRRAAQSDLRFVNRVGLKKACESGISITFGASAPNRSANRPKRCLLFRVSPS